MQLSLLGSIKKIPIFPTYNTYRSRVPTSNPSLGLTHHITRLFIQVLYPRLPFGFKFFKELIMVRERLVILVAHKPFLFKFCPRTVDNINIRAVSHLALSFVMSPRCLRSAGGIFLFKFFRLNVDFIIGSESLLSDSVFLLCPLSVAASPGGHFCDSLA